MNRDIKFRAWDHVNKKILFADIYEIQSMDGEWTAWDHPDGSPTNTGTPFDIMQYTGLKDKNGVEIYEGDIVLMHTEWSGGYDSEDFGEHENKGVVSIVPSKGVMLNKCLKRDLIECEDQWSKTWPVNVRSCRSVVIGNIYENPELLKTVKNG